MNNQLSGKVAIITGGASGIGEAVARLYAKNGCKVALMDIDKERLSRITDEIKNDGGECVCYATDVAKEDEVINVFKDVTEKWGRLDLLVNSAGRDSLSPPVSEVSLDEWNLILGTNLTGVFLCCREAFRIMEKQESGGRIMNMGSSSAKLASSPGHSPYRASKHGMMGFSKNILLEGMNKNIGVTVINLSHVKTPMTQIIDKGLYEGDMPAYLDGWLDEHEKKNGIHESCIDVENVSEIALYVATRTPDVTIPQISLYPTAKAHRYGMEV
jgi:NAD(P)-dependent dehydrogenase (short-subunit alcohol dehydrogenase family)